MSNPISRVSVLALSALPALMLAACGDLEPTPYHGVPYTHERTAGSGVAYVRASMLPPREANTAVISEKPAAEPAKIEPPPVEAPVTQGDHLFDSKQAK